MPVPKNRVELGRPSVPGRRAEAELPGRGGAAGARRERAADVTACVPAGAGMCAGSVCGAHVEPLPQGGGVGVPGA